MTEFHRVTPRIILIAHAAYRRRRAWAGWHAGALSRFEFEDGFPTIARLAGESEADEAQSDAELTAVGMAWIGVFQKMKGNPDGGDGQA